MHCTFEQWKIYSLGDHAIVFELPPNVNTQTVNLITALHHFIQSKNKKGILDFIPSYHTLTLIIDFQIFDEATLGLNEHLTILFLQWMNEFNQIPKQTLLVESPIIKVPVCYDVSMAFDLAQLAKSKKLSLEQVIAIHTQTIYTIYAIGFLPGFTYMGAVDESIQMPRHEKPRSLVPAGSVGIAGVQTGIYPIDSPGGWQIVGRSPWAVFDPNPNVLAKFKVGDSIQFYEISKIQFEKMNEH